MEGDRKPIVWMLLFGIIRHVLGIAGAWLASRGLIDADTHERLLSEGASQLVGYVLMALPIAWSIAQKLQVVRWLQTALHLDGSRKSLAEVPSAARSGFPL